MGRDSKLYIKKYVTFLNLSFIGVACVFFLVYFSASEFLVLTSKYQSGENDCKTLKQLDNYKAKCLYLRANGSCVSQGYIDYLSFFYCNFARFPQLGHCLVFLWLLILFYLLGNTASEYFCSSLESLAKLLQLSPTIAGVTLLSLGNGAPDVFASLVSFMGDGTSDVGINTVLGGASFVTCVVVGIISILLHQKGVKVEKSDFFRDVCFFLLALAYLGAILVHGKINLWGALGFFSLYIAYVIVVYVSHIRGGNGARNDEGGGNSSYGMNDLSVPILDSVNKGALNFIEAGDLENDIEEPNKSCFCLRSSTCCITLLYILELPLYLPRRLTIPVVSEKGWSKPIAIASVTLAPILLALIWRPPQNDSNLSITLVVYGLGLLVGLTFGVFAFVTTEKSNPPTKCLFPWLAGGFLMSVVWSYMTAQELVGLLVSIGHIFGISPSILGLTVLAWGNSLGDLIANSAMALNGGPEGAQVAISACYAGPIFNTLFGLGLSLVGSCWYAYPSSIDILFNSHLLETLGFLVGGLLWPLLILPSRDMRLNGVLGWGLLTLYLVSLSLRLMQTLGSLQFPYT
ncbi:cation/calcium exchanger 2 [Carica papaya]|uniref:cation/calcium exchanger 2 n=1 Tax=Carica papaya TaxID=3649 RepID=UPI000B8D1A1B|nr:cation/calcium exchanger 2 [Carica papaya]